MKSRSMLHAAMPLAALLLNNCVTQDEVGREAGSSEKLAISALSQGSLPFNNSQYTTMKGDFNGDGKKDLFFIDTNGKVEVRLSNGSNLNSQLNLLNAGAFGSLSGGKYLLGDMNGDGKTDLFFIGNGGDVHVRLSDGHTLNTYRQLLYAGAFGNWSSGLYLMGDVNADQKTDLFFIGNGGDLHMRKSDGITYNTYLPIYGPGAYGTPSTGKYLFGDHDGDGRLDLFFIGNAGDIHVRLSNNYGFPAATQLATAGQFGNWTWSNGQFMLGDFTGDAKDDLFFIDNSGSLTYVVGLGTPQAYSIYMWGSNAYGNIAGGQYYVGDFSGDNRKDLFFIGNTGDVHVRISNGSIFDAYTYLLGAGTYGSLTSGVYQ